MSEEIPGQLPPVCPHHTALSMTVASRQRVRESAEVVVYVEQLIKKFNREGAENMETIRMPEFVERVIDVELVDYRCSECDHTKTVRENESIVSETRV